MSTIGKYLITPSNNNHWVVSWVEQNKRIHVRVFDLEGQLGSVVDYIANKQEEFAALITAIVSADAETISNQPNILQFIKLAGDDYVELICSPLTFSNYRKLLTVALSAFNEINGTNLSTFDVDPLLIEVRKRVLA